MKQVLGGSDVALARVDPDTEALDGAPRGRDIGAAVVGMRMARGEVPGMDAPAGFLSIQLRKDDVASAGPEVECDTAPPLPLPL